MLDWRPGCLCAAYCPTERGLQILEELDHALARSKHMVGLITVGVVALTTLIASATTPA